VSHYFIYFYIFFQPNPFYVKPRVANNKFGIKHYAGEVRIEFITSSLMCTLKKFYNFIRES